MITLEGLDPCLFCENPDTQVCKNCEDKSIFMLDTEKVEEESTESI